MDEPTTLAQAVADLREHNDWVERCHMDRAEEAVRKNNPFSLAALNARHRAWRQAVKRRYGVST